MSEPNKPTCQPKLSDAWPARNNSGTEGLRDALFLRGGFRWSLAGAALFFPGGQRPYKQARRKQSHDHSSSTPVRRNVAFLL